MNALQKRMMQRLENLRPGTTMCPGQLARDCDSTLNAARADLLALTRSGAVALSQRGKSASPDDLKGPFRVRLKRPD
jgi:hypothetical protein